MSERTADIEEWEAQRRPALRSLMLALDAGDIDLDVDPLAFLPILEAFVAGQDYARTDEDDMVWLHSILGAYLSELIIHKYGAFWRIQADGLGRSYVLVVAGADGKERVVAPMDVVYEGLQTLPPVVGDMIGAAERLLD